jgi:alcohol dehydrogenase (cytochrome c)
MLRAARLLSRVAFAASLATASGDSQLRVSAQAPAPAQLTISYTTAQAANGRRVYLQLCASCHADAGGTANGPPLVGPDFRQRWFGRAAQPLFDYTRARMPPTGPASLPQDTYVDILAYLFSRSGLAPGTSRLSADAASLGAQLPWQIPQGGGETPGGLALPAAPPRVNPLDAISPVTDTMLASPPPSEWLTWRRTWDSQGFSPLKQITASNVSSLRIVWSWALPPGPNEGTPLFHDGVLFVQSSGDKVQALDAVSGDLLWQYSPPAAGGGFSVKRAIALYGEHLYVTTSDGRVVALSAKQGTVVWSHALNNGSSEGSPAFVVTGGPLVARGKVMVGVAGSAYGGNFIIGLDARNGEECWRVYTVARPDAPGGNSWNGLPLARRNGGSVWVPGSYDPVSNLAYFGTAQTYDTAPLRTASAEPGVTSDALYTDSTLAINPDSGALAWHFQHLPNDQWDLDWALERVLFRVPGQSQTLVATAGKQAIYDVLDAATGRYTFSIDLGLQDLVTGIDPETGAKQVDRTRTPGNGASVSVCPHSVGAKSWLPEALNPGTARLFAPLNEACMDLVPVQQGERGMLSSGVRWMLRPRAGSDGKYGRLQAIDLNTRTMLWQHRQRAPLTTGVLATAGGLVFVGRMDRTFAAHSESTGKELWTIRLNDVPNGAPVTYSYKGRQYVALTVGNGGALATTFPLLLPELKNPPDRSASLFVFALPGR